MLGDPVAGGRFGDVYKGRFRGREIAIKVLRVYQKSDMNKLLKVTRKPCILNRRQLKVMVRNSRLKLSYGSSYLTPMFYRSTVYIISTITHQEFALYVPGWKMGT